MALKSKAKKKTHNNTQQQYEDNLFESDDTFAFIAGYTAGGFPYGITWEEIAEIEQNEKEKIWNIRNDLNDEEYDLPFN